MVAPDIEYRSVRRCGYTFEFPVYEPIGHKLDPTDVVIDPQGQVVVPIWRPQDQDFRIFKLEHMIVPTLAAAIRQCDHVVAGYHQESKSITTTVTHVQFALGQYLNWDKVQFGQTSDGHIQCLLEFASWLEGARRPEKRKASDHLLQVISRRGRDSRGRYNPQVMATYLFATIFQLEGKRAPGLRQIVVVEVARKAVLELTRQVNQTILQTLCQELHQLIRLPIFYTPARPVGLPYHQLAIKVEQIGVPSKGLWGAPYTQLAVEIHNCVAQTRDFLNDRCQLKAKQVIRTLLSEINRCPASLGKIRTAAGALHKSRNWREQHFASVSAQCDRLRQMVDELPAILHLISQLLNETLSELENLIKKGNWDSAATELDRLIARCEW